MLQKLTGCMRSIHFFCVAMLVHTTEEWDDQGPQDPNSTNAHFNIDKVGAGTQRPSTH